MRRFLLSAVAALATVSAVPMASAQTLKVVMHSDVKVLDPIWSGAYITRNHGYMLYDVLFAMDEKFQVKPQMVDTWTTSDDGLVWTFKLRDGLEWHDGQPVTAEDCIASLKRWSARDAMGQKLAESLQEYKVVDAKTFQIVLKQKFGAVIESLGKPSVVVPFMMPKRIAETDPFKQIEEYVGSGPMKFARGEWKPGALAVFEKFKDYVPRGEAPMWLSGGKVVNFDRIEWIIMPDPATASAALQNGEIDWWETPLSDLVPVLKKNRNIKIDIADPLGNLGSFRLNHLHPPFNDVRIRRAVQIALSQEDYMRAIVGDDTNLWKPCPSFFTPGTALYTETGGEPLKGKRDIEAAKKLLKEAGYAGQPVTCVVAQDQPIGWAVAVHFSPLPYNIFLLATLLRTPGVPRPIKVAGGAWFAAMLVV